MIYVIVNKEGLITNRIITEDAWVNDDPDTAVVQETDQEYFIGGTLINGVYSPPVLPVPEPVKITQVSPRQARIALLNAGLLDQVETAVNQAGAEAKIYWDYSLVLHRDAPLIATLGKSLGLTDTQIDNLFTQAATL